VFSEIRGTPTRWSPYSKLQLLGSAMMTSELYQNHHATADDPSSVSYIPRMARTVPQACAVHDSYIVEFATQVGTPPIAA